MWCPTLRTSSSERPGSTSSDPSSAGVGAVAVHRAGDRLPALGEARLQLAGHQAEPGPVAADLVRAVDGGDGVLQVDDRGDRRLEHDVRDLRVVLAADPVAAVDRQLDVQAVPAQQHRLRRTRVAAVPASCVGSASPTAPSAVSAASVPAVETVGGDVGVRGPLQREVRVEQPVGLRDHLRAAPLVVAAGELVVQRQRVGAVERVEQRAPAGVRGVERVPRDRRRDDELRARHLGDLAVHPGDGDARLLLRQQVADLGEERPRSRRGRPRRARRARGARRRAGPAARRAGPAARPRAGRTARAARPASTRTTPASDPPSAAARRPRRRAARDPPAGRRSGLAPVWAASLTWIHHPRPVRRPRSPVSYHPGPTKAGSASRGDPGRQARGTRGASCRRSWASTLARVGPMLPTGMPMSWEIRA